MSYPPPAGCSTVLLYGQRRDLNAYLAATPGAPHGTLAEIIAFNSTYIPPMKYGQAIFDAADQLGLAGTADDVDAILASANSFAATPAKAGYPSITVPGGFAPATPPIENPFPSGVTFTGPAFSEPALIGLAYAFEQAPHHRQPPASTPPLPTDSVSRP